MMVLAMDAMKGISMSEDLGDIASKLLNVAQGISVICITANTISFEIPDTTESLEILNGTEFTGVYRGLETEDGILYACFSIAEYENRTYAIEPHLISSISLVDAGYCFSCEQYHLSYHFKRHPLISDKSIILSQICVSCYKRAKNKIEFHRSLARRHGGTAT